MENNIELNYNDVLSEVNTLADLFDSTVKNFPQEIALCDNDHNRISYQELSDKVDLLAGCLSAKGVEKGSKVVLILEKSEFMITSIIAILKLGGVYIPLDAASPLETVNQVVEEVNPKLVILDLMSLPKVTNNTVELLFAEDNFTGAGPFKDYPIIDAEDDAYIIYTSGTTGRKKGVLIQHNSIINTLKWRIKYYKFGPQDAVLQIPSYAFDSSVLDIFSCIGSGAELVLVDDKRKTDMDYFISKLETCNVTNFIITPSFYHYVLPYLEESYSLRIITLAGEATSVKLKNDHFNKFPDVVLINEYGPTENAVCSTVKQLGPLDKEVTIGKAINNVQVCILNEDLKEVQTFEKGEIYLGGIGLAREYFCQKELTARRFIKINEKIWYKTGDVATWNDEEEILYFGRTDRQIQLNGYRVELSEIELQLQKLNIADRVEIVAQKNEQETWKVIAFYSGQTSIDVADCRIKLLKVLPAYMIPNGYIKVDAFPLTQNGKLDQEALWEEYKKTKSINIAEKKTAQPASETERILLRLVKGIVKSEEVDLNSDLFTIGLDSLNSIKLIDQINKELGHKLLIVDLYNNSTIKKLSKELLVTAN